MVEWIIHLKDGRTLTDKDAYPHEIPTEQITSVERIVNGKAYTICSSPVLQNFFVKTAAARSISLTGKGARAPVITERIIGCYVVSGDKFIRVEICIDPRTGSCKLVAVPVKKMTKDGF